MDSLAAAHPPARVPSQTPPGDRTLPAPSPAKSCPKEMKCIVLVDWWLERLDDKICIAGLTETPQMRKEGFSSQGSRKSAGRVFRCAIAKVCDCVIVETVKGHLVRISGFLNNTRMRENGFSDKVCETLMGGFPLQWKKLVDLNMEEMNGHEQSPPESMSDGFVDSTEYSFTENNFNSFGDCEPADLGEAGTPNCGKTLMKLRTGDEVPAAGIGAVQASEENKARTLRSGRALGGPISAPITGGNKQKKTQHKASENAPNEAVSPTADLTSYENVCSVAPTSAKDELKSHDSCSKGRSGRYAKRLRKHRDLFSSFM